MINNPTTSNNASEEPEKQETIFSGITDLSSYEAGIKSTRNWLYFVAGICLVWGIVFYNLYSGIFSRTFGYLILGGCLAISLSFVVFAIWSKRRPAMAFLLALIFYISLNIWLYFMVSYSFQSVIIRLFIIIQGVKGYLDARKYEQLKQTLDFGEEGSLL